MCKSVSFFTKGLSGAWHLLLPPFSVKLLITSSASLWCCRNGCLCKVDTESQIETQRSPSTRAPATPPLRPPSPSKTLSDSQAALVFPLKVFIFPRGKRNISVCAVMHVLWPKLKMARHADINPQKWRLTELEWLSPATLGSYLRKSIYFKL